MSAEQHKPILIKPENDSCYFDRLREGYRVVAEYRNSLASAEKAPMYVAQGYDREGEPYGIHENLAPWEAAEEAAQAVAKNPEARRLLRAHQFTVEPTTPEGGILILNKNGDPVRSGDIPLFRK